MILLDTQSLVWLAERSGRLGPNAVRLEAESEQVYVSAITMWELGLLVSRSKLTLSLPLARWLDVAVENNRTTIVPVTREIALDAGTLPGYGHGDPGDRIILATARAYNCPVMTSDQRMLTYAKAGHVQALDARH